MGKRKATDQLIPEDTKKPAPLSEDVVADAIATEQEMADEQLPPPPPDAEIKQEEVQVKQEEVEVKQEEVEVKQEKIDTPAPFAAKKPAAIQFENVPVIAKKLVDDPALFEKRYRVNARTNPKGGCTATLTDKLTLCDAYFRLEDMMMVFDSEPRSWNESGDAGGGATAPGFVSADGTQAPTPAASAGGGKLTWKAVAKPVSPETAEGLEAMNTALMKNFPRSVEKDETKYKVLDSIAKAFYGRRTRKDGSENEEADIQFNVPMTEEGYAKVSIWGPDDEPRHNVSCFERGTRFNCLFGLRYYKVGGNVGVTPYLIQMRVKGDPVDLSGACVC